MLDATDARVSKVGFVLTRVVVPLWILTGALLKLAERTPKLLPRNIWMTGDRIGIDLYWLLAGLIVLELLAIGLMWFAPRLAKPTAVFMLVCFCVILLAEILSGNTACGCLGAYSPPPWVMLLIDGSLLLGVLLFATSPGQGPWLPAARRVPIAAWVGAGALACGLWILPQASATAEVVADPPGGAAEDEPVDEATAPAATPVQPQVASTAGVSISSGASTGPRRARKLEPYHVPRPDTWQGRRWQDIPLAQFMPTWPTDVTAGLRYVVFYSKSCSHCQDLFQQQFYQPPVPTAIVAIPESKTGFNPDTWLPMECPGCEELDMPVGSDWIISTPLVVALENGIVQCAREGDDPNDPQCLVWH